MRGLGVNISEDAGHWIGLSQCDPSTYKRLFCLAHQMVGQTRTGFHLDPGAGKITEQKGTIDLDLSGHSKFL